MKDFRDLKIWQKGHQLALLVYGATKAFPKEEIYGLTSQMRRASTSVPANIAEGCGRGGDGELNRFLRIAMGSASEIEYYIVLAKDLGLINEPEHKRVSTAVEELKKMLAAFIGRINHGQIAEAANRRHRRVSPKADPDR